MPARPEEWSRAHPAGVESRSWEESMAKRQVFEVKFDKVADKWAVAQRGGEQVSTHAKKETAVDRAKALAKAADLGQVVIKKQDGRIQTEHTYGKDPRRTKG
jgi:hypothetical protein